MKFPYRDTDPAREGFQCLEDLATAYWYSEVLFAALELNIFERLAAGPVSLSDLTVDTGWDPDGLGRFLATLIGLGLVVEFDGRFSNGPLADRYLVPGGTDDSCDFIQYRRYFLPHWHRLSRRVREGATANERPEEESPDAYQKRVIAYVEAMDRQAIFKAGETLDCMENLQINPPRRILDIGGGAGSWCRALLKHWPGARAVLFDLPEVMEVTGRLYPDPEYWKGIERVAGDVLSLCIKSGRFDLVILSNLLHVYGKGEATMILDTVARRLASGGTVLIHDYLLDEHDGALLKGRLYDLHMMLNTYNGRVYGKEELTAMLEAVGLRNSNTFQLRSDTWVILAQKVQGETDKK